MKKFFLSLNPWMKAAVIFSVLIFLTIVINHILFPTPKQTLAPEPELTFEELDVQKMPAEVPPVEPEKPAVSAKAPAAAPIAPISPAPVVKPAVPAAQPAPVASAPSKTPAPAQAVSGEFYSIQVSSVREKANAESLSEKLRKEGYEVDVITKDFKNGTWSIVLVGHYPTRAEAEKKLPQLKNEFKDCFIKLRKAN